MQSGYTQKRSISERDRSSPAIGDFDFSERETDTIEDVEETLVVSVFVSDPEHNARAAFLIPPQNPEELPATKRRRTNDATPHLDGMRVEQLTNADRNILHCHASPKTTLVVDRAVFLLIPYFQAAIADGDAVILTGDHFNTFRIIMIILHHKPSSLPVVLDSNELLQLALLCKKYDVVDLVSPHVAHHYWVTNLCKNLERAEKLSKDWFRILSTFDVHQILEDDCMMNLVAANMYEQDGKWSWGLDDEVDGVLDIGSWNATLLERLRLKRSKLWSATSGDCHLLMTCLLSETPRDYESIGKLFAFMKTELQILNSEESIIARLRAVSSLAAQTRWGDIIRDKLDALLRQCTVE